MGALVEKEYNWNKRVFCPLLSWLSNFELELEECRSTSLTFHSSSTKPPKAQ